MDGLLRFLVGLLGVGIVFGCSVLSMIYGWGLTPQSWFFILVVGFGGVLFGWFIFSIAVEGK